MSYFHGKAAKVDTSHPNFMAGKSWDINNPLTKLRIAASSCFFGEPMYYHRDVGDKRKAKGVVASTSLSATQVKHLRETLDAVDPSEWRSMTPAELLESAIDAALTYDAAGTLAFAGELRNKHLMRTTPQVILVRAAHHPTVRGTGLIRLMAPNIIKRADEPSVGLAYQLWRYKDKPIPNSLKKAWRAALESFNDYQLAKYRMEKREVKTVDVVNLVHPKSLSVHKLVRGELTTTGETWESIISAEGSNTTAWTKAVESMGHMALLKNLRNLVKHKVPHSEFAMQLIEGAKTGKQLPFRYYSAYNAVKAEGGSARVLDAIEESLNQSLVNLPKLHGKVMCLCDNSGSAQNTTQSKLGTMKMSTIANLTGVLAGACADDGYVGVFGNNLEVVPIRRTSSVFDQLDKLEKIALNIGGDTENGVWLFFDNAIKSKEHWDNIFIFSDMQAGHGGLYGINPREYWDYVFPHPRAAVGIHIDVAKLVSKYRSVVNPDVNVFLVQVAGYQDTLIPEFYKRTYILGGWGPGLLRFAAEMAELPGR